MIRLALRLFWREWRAGELRILVAALIIAVAALTAIGIYTDRISRALENQAAELLGGDIQITSSTPLPSEWRIEAHKMGLQETTLVLFSSMLVIGDQFQLANMKAVTSNYPLRGGRLRTKLALDKTDTIEENIPASGTIWVEPRLLSLLHIPLNTAVKIGHAQLNVKKILSYEPDAQPYNLNIAPRVLMNQADLEATGIIQPGSRVEYRCFLVGESNAIKKFSAWVTPKLSVNQKLQHATEGLAELKNTLQKSHSYLHLATIICVILAGIAIATAARRYSQRHYDISALLRCFGVTQHRILQLYLSYLFCLGIAGSFIGIIIGFIAQLRLTSLFSAWITLPLPSPQISSLLFSFLIGLVILFGFALPPILALKNIPPIRILRRDNLTLSNPSLLIYGLALAVIIGLLLIQTGNVILTALFLSSLFVAGAVLYAAAWGLIAVTARLRSTSFGGQALRYGLANLARRSTSSTIQLVAFGLVIMTILLLTLIRNDLLHTWRQQLPKTAPNYFALNIQPQEVTPINQLLTRHHIEAAGIYPIVRGRLTHLNNKPILQAIPVSARGNNALNRELNLTWTDTIPADNQIIQGKWWTPEDQEKSALSIEAKLAKDLGISIGDQLTFQVGSKSLQATVNSIRSLDWDTFHPNFYIIFPSGLLNAMPTTYITSFHVAPAQKSVLNELVRQFPNVTLIDIEMILAQAIELTDKIALLIEFILIFTLAAGVAVLYAALQTSRDERLLEGAILRTLGASSATLKISLATEFIILGLLAGFLGAVGASTMGFLLATQVFQMTYHWNFEIWLIGIFGGAILIGLFGWYGTRDVIKQSPLVVLREI